jgi:nucleotide-binding universal stress UspA family protein
MKTVLACIDFSETERPVIEAAAALAGAFAGELHVLHVGLAARPHLTRGPSAQTILREAAEQVLRGARVPVCVVPSPKSATPSA